MKRVNFRLEFLLRASPTIIYEFLTTPDCLTRWFCDSCEIEENRYLFSWESGDEEIAYLVEDIEEYRLRFKWEDSEFPAEFFEYRITISEVTSETIFEVFDWCYENEVKDQKQYWTTQVESLKRAMGAM